METGEMGDHLPIKRPRQDQSSVWMEMNCDITEEIGDHLPSSKSQLSSESPVAAKPFPKNTNWADLFVKELKEIASASDLDDVRNRADKLLKSFKASERACLIPRITEEQPKKAGSYEGPLDQNSFDLHVTTIDPFVPNLIETDSEDEDGSAGAKLREIIQRKMWGVDENGRMSEHGQRMRQKLGLGPLVFGPIDKQP